MRVRRPGGWAEAGPTDAASVVRGRGVVGRGGPACGEGSPPHAVGPDAIAPRSRWVTVRGPRSGGGEAPCG